MYADVFVVKFSSLWLDNFVRRNSERRRASHEKECVPSAQLSPPYQLPPPAKMLSMLLEVSSAPYFFGYMGAAFALVFASKSFRTPAPRAHPVRGATPPGGSAGRLASAERQPWRRRAGARWARVCSPPFCLPELCLVVFCRPRRCLRHRQERRWRCQHGCPQAGARDALHHSGRHGRCHRYLRSDCRCHYYRRE